MTEILPFLSQGTGEFVNTKFWCRVCALLHDPTLADRIPGGYDDINAWWRSQGTCINGSWRKYAAALEKKVCYLFTIYLAVCLLFFFTLENGYCDYFHLVPRCLVPN